MKSLDDEYFEYVERIAEKALPYFLKRNRVGSCLVGGDELLSAKEAVDDSFMLGYVMLNARNKYKNHSTIQILEKLFGDS